MSGEGLFSAVTTGAAGVGEGLTSAAGGVQFETINCRVLFFSIFCHSDLYFHLILIFPLKFV